MDSEIISNLMSYNIIDPMPEYDRSIFIFRRDYRLFDNLGLIEALKKSKIVIPIFIFTPEQIDDSKNSYKSDNSVQFMIQSLRDLNLMQLKKKGSKLRFFYGTPHQTIEKLLKQDKRIEAVYVNQDYSPYSRKRDEAIEKVCGEQRVNFHSIHDGLLQPVSSVKTDGGSVYKKFTPFFNKVKKEKVPKPKSNARRNFLGASTKLTGEFRGSLEKFYKKNDKLFKTGGRQNALKILKYLKEHKDYNKTRNNLTGSTTHLSAYIKFGCVSIREVYNAFKEKLGEKNDLIKQLYWRDFYHNILWAYPRVIGGAMKTKYNELEWDNNMNHFKKWKKGTTGYPVVDAAMRSMNATGFMHNRGRLIVSNFLIKICLIDWRWGEKYFAQMLMDYDVANNNGNWQWGASTGADSQPYFRVFNPWLQSEKFDPKAEYIKKWVPELKDVPAKHIHKWDEHFTKYQKKVDYPEPMIDYKKGKEDAIKAYKKVA
jgi:deoxyribodipyrimidine photo-lyase